MQQIQISEEALPLLKSSIGFQKKLFNKKIESYLNRLKAFEKKYGMVSSKFYEEFEKGTLGDDPEWYDWLFVFEAYHKTIQKKLALEELAL